MRRLDEEDNSLILFDMLWQVLPLSVVTVLKYVITAF